MKINILDKKLVPLPESILLTEKADKKMWALVRQYDKEIAWHGVMKREGKNLIISDILVYPQTTSSATVDADEEQYPLWIAQLPDESFEYLRMQGHSHVDMACVPSGTDESYYKDLIGQFDDHYLVMIANKRGELFVRYYDIENNIVVEGIPVRTEHSYEDWANEQIEQYVKPISLTYDSLIQPSGYPKKKGVTLFWDKDNQRLTTIKKGLPVAELNNRFNQKYGATYYEVHDGPYGVSEYLTVYNETYLPDVWFFVIGRYDENVQVDTFTDLMMSYHQFPDGILYNRYTQFPEDINKLGTTTPVPEELLIKKVGK